MVLVFYLTAAIFSASALCVDDRECVTTSYGVVQGKTLTSGVRAFLGILYVAPPVGDLRWRSPAACRCLERCAHMYGVRPVVSAARTCYRQGNRSLG